MDDVKLIKTEAQYEAALARAFDLMNARKGTPEGDELELRSKLIEDYEDQKFPIDLPDPITAIKFAMEQASLKQVDLIPIIGSRSKVSEVLSGKRNLTLKMIRALNNYLGIPAEVLIKDPQGSLPPELAGIQWHKYPLSGMKKLGWIEGARDMKDRAEEIMRALMKLAVDSGDLPLPHYRKNNQTRVNAKTDQYALHAWCIHILGKARSKTLDGSFTPGTVTPNFMGELAKLSAFREGPKLAQEHLSRHGIALIIAEHLPRTHLDGAAMMTIEGTPVIGMTLRYDRLDNFWFCLMHELAHIGRHIDGDSHTLFVDDLTLIAGEGDDVDRQEKEADEWAEEALIPKEIWNRHPVKYEATPLNVMALAHQLKISPSIVAGRVRYERHKDGFKNAYRLLTKFVKNGEVQHHFKEFSS